LVPGVYSCEGDRQFDPPRGVFGGWDGLVASCRKNADRSDEEYLEAKVTGIPFDAGDFIELVEPNAAGYGDPRERDPELVREDVLDDFTTLELARDAYGVVFADESTLEIDAQATEELRQELRARQDGTGSLTKYFDERDQLRRPNPVSAASDKEFGKS
jgi:N-methylhydantoinase B/oxoprolinase/acetone carboxylase alpha subunit